VHKRLRKRVSDISLLSVFVWEFIKGVTVIRLYEFIVSGFIKLQRGETSSKFGGVRYSECPSMLAGMK